MKTTTKKTTGIKVTTNVKAGGMAFPNHNRAGLKVRSALRAGMAIIYRNHSRIGLKVRTTLRAGATIIYRNHNARMLPLD